MCTLFGRKLRIYLGLFHLSPQKVVLSYGLVSALRNPEVDKRAPDESRVRPLLVPMVLQKHLRAHDDTVAGGAYADIHAFPVSIRV